MSRRPIEIKIVLLDILSVVAFLDARPNNLSFKSDLCHSKRQGQKLVPDTDHTTPQSHLLPAVNPR